MVGAGLLEGDDDAAKREEGLVDVLALTLAAVVRVARGLGALRARQVHHVQLRKRPR